MICEAALIIDEGIVERAEDVDLVWVNGYGFPRYRGGPLYWADTVGLRVIADAIDKCATRLGEDYWQPAAGLRDRAARNMGFISGRGR